jgi:type II secretory pathway pseudopilin PulG
MTPLTASAGYSLIELMMAMALAVTMTAAAVPQYLAGIDDLRASAAARHVSGRLQRARMEAVTRSASVGVQFTALASGGYAYGVYVDGNRNGVLTRDIQRGIDRSIGAVETLPASFAGVEFGLVPGLPPVDAGGIAPGADPIRLGSGNIASFSALGTATSGTVYIRSRRAAQYAVRIYGDTGKTRLLKFEPGTGQWKPL